MFGISGPSSSSVLSADYLNALVTQAMRYHQRSYDLLKAQRDQLHTMRSLYTELQGLLNTLRNQAEDLAAGVTSAFGAKRATSSNTSVVTASATSSATLGVYEIAIATLAKAHRVRSEQQLYTNQALGLAGTFVIGGLQSRAVSSKVTVANTVDDFGVGSALASGQRELGSGTYYVEVRDNIGSWEFRLVDEDGTAISIANVTNAGNFTSEWQSLSAVAGQTYDTGRGLTIFFGSGSYTPGLRGSGAASVRYDAKGVEISVTSSSTLADIASAINNGTYAIGNEVVATIVDRQLILTAANTGTRHRIVASDLTGTVLSGTGSSGLGILGDGGSGDVDPTDGFRFTLQQAVNTSMKVNGINITRQARTGLTDVISGVTLNLLAEGAEAKAALTVAADTTTVTNKITEFITQFNKVTAYLKSKSDVTQTVSGTYTRGGLAGESTLYRLRLDLLSDLNRPIPLDSETSVSVGDPTSLREIGITIDSNLHLVISDSGKLNSALTSNFHGVARLFNVLMDRLVTRLEPYTRTVGGIMDRLIQGVDGQIKDLDGSLKAMQERMQLQEAYLRRQYTALFGQIYAASAGQSLLGGIFLSGMLFNRAI
ncbi:MAG: flagellar filament capping protein FliD [Anaerolineae bacterium]|nr:flagellar filament capping protein FliD [Anaerolineae bacterium]MDW8098416.1 flagellar filament capping protein FliD [Anaerolineae bacterium]